MSLIVSYLMDFSNSTPKKPSRHTLHSDRWWSSNWYILRIRKDLQRNNQLDTAYQAEENSPPLNSGWSRWKCNLDSRKYTYSLINGPYPFDVHQSCILFFLLFLLPRIPSPATPLINVSSQLTCCCASLTTIGWPSWRTLCIVISALNVCTSSARMGCLYLALAHTIQPWQRRKLTLSSPPKRQQKTYCPMYRQYNSGHVCLDRERERESKI